MGTGSAKIPLMTPVDESTAMLEVPLGVWLRVIAPGEAILAVEFTGPPAAGASTAAPSPLLKEGVSQLRAYLEGRLYRFDLPLKPAGTVFRRHVWQALTAIPYGETRSYRDVAQQIGSPNAVRAVGAANGANPIAIVVPCHRVVGANGKLTGYGGGLPLKQFLLELEARWAWKARGGIPGAD
jgi:O-6-methylguanine DNA methyltransferase